MGCDISIVPEVFRDGSWHVAEPFIPNVYDATKWLSHPFDLEFSGRRHPFFARLTGTVSSYGMEGPHLGEPRGFPKNASPGLISHYNNDSDQHSTHWVTLRELLDFNWDYLIDKPLEAQSIFLDLSGGIVHLLRIMDTIQFTTSLAEFASLPRFTLHDRLRIEAGLIDFYNPPIYMVRLSDNHSIRDSIGARYLKALFEKLQSYGPEPKYIRIVFWFHG